MATNASSSVQTLLLQEAQQEIAVLRTDLYNTRRIAEERRQSEQSLQAAQASLKIQVEQLSSQLQTAQVAVSQLPGALEQARRSEQVVEQLQKDLDLSLRARRILENELVLERKDKDKLAAEKAGLEAERSRLLKTKDDLTTSLRVAQRKAQEAEEELIRAEEEAQTLRAELKATQHGSLESSGTVTESQSYADLPAAEQHHDRHHHHVHELEQERKKAAETALNLEESRAENARLEQEVSVLHGVIAQLKRQMQALQHQLEQEKQHSQGHHSRHEKLQQHSEHGHHSHHHSQHHHDMQSIAVQTETDGSQISVGDSQHRLQTSSHGGYNGYGSQGGMHVSQSIASLAASEHENLLSQIIKLKASRDKLLEQIDRQWEDLDRLSNENRGLGEQLQRIQHVSACWEAQAQKSMAAEDRLKDMLLEASTWQPNQAAPSSGPTSGTQDMHGALLAERSRKAELDLQVRALAAELLRSQQASMAIGKAVLPALSGIEHRLGMLTQQASQAAAAIAKSSQDPVQVKMITQGA